MDRIPFNERANWKDDADQVGFTFHSMKGERYWDERHAYQFSLNQVENDIEDPTAELLSMCYEAVDRISGDSELMTKMAIPEAYHDAVRTSWKSDDLDLYGRFDFSYDGLTPAKLLEFNADTPTSLLEASVFQWRWLEDMKARGEIPKGADQFNSIHEKLIRALSYFSHREKSLHVAAVMESVEDRCTVEYLADCAIQGGLDVTLMDISEIGIDAEGRFTDTDDRPIKTLFKLYPLEDMVREEFGRHLLSRPSTIIEPLWKLTLSNKGLMAVLWDMFPNHQNLLPAYFDDGDESRRKVGTKFVRKPLLSREGANVSIIDWTAQNGSINAPGPYGEEGHIVQGYHPLPKFGDDWAVIGSWVVAGLPAGMGIREDNTPITKNTSRFVPHYIL